MFKILKVELLKLRRSYILPITVMVPALCLAQGITSVKNPVSTMEQMDPWYRLFYGTVVFYSALFLPCIIAFIMAMAARVEHRDNGWKQLLALPVGRGSVYFAKLLAGCMVILSNIAVLIISILICGGMLGITTPVPYDIIVGRSLLIFASAAPITALMYFLSICFSHIGVPAGAGVALAFPAMLVANSAKYWIFYPWTYPIYTALASSGFGFAAGDRLSVMWMACAAGFVVITLAGFYRFRRYDVI